MKELISGLILKNNINNIDELVNAIETITLTCYGVVSLSSKSLADVNKKNVKTTECILISKRSKNVYKVKLYVSLMTGVKITEVLSEIQKRIKYEMENRFHVTIEAVDVYVQTMLHEK